MNIDDVLAEVSAPSDLPRETKDLQELTRAWVNEKCAPEVLPWPGDLVDRILDRIKRQIEIVEDQTGDLDPKINFRLIIVQTELERFKFLVRSFLRTRLAKIDQHAPHYLSLPSENLSTLLSEYEQQYATKHQSLLSSHFQSSFLAAFPPQLQRLDDTAGGISMLEGPDMDTAVFIRCLRDGTDLVAVRGTDIAFEMSRGDIYVTRWSAVRALVQRGEAELI